MNLVDCYVKEVIGRPIYRYKLWWVAVKYEVENRVSSTSISFPTLEYAKRCQIGYRFLN